ncbi:MAG: zinc-ribbon domain containing protein [Desulfomonilaceae bacterium]|nr:zinc-ribbon domain containing protein [Desulfomonilaceae bacterium]
MPDAIMTCVICESTFVFGEAEQKRCARLGFEDPKRCPECRHKKRKQARDPSPKVRKGKSLFDAIDGESG